jgi:V8-like Glu-specific endopeptidase
MLGIAAVLATIPACDPVDGSTDVRRSAMDEDPWRGGDLPPFDPPPPVEPLLPIDDGQACQNSPTVYLNIGNEMCSGVMIAPDVMLTAGHCVRNGANLRSLASMSVGTGANVCEGSVKVDEVFVHPDFSNQRIGRDQSMRRPAAGDLAVVRLSGPVPGTTVATLGSSTPGTASASVTMTGFSRGSQNCANATVTGTQFIQTGSLGSQPVHVIEGELNPDGTRAHACVGDSGGPVYLRGTNVVVGINSQVGDTIPGLPWGTVGGPTPTTCTPPLYAPFDWSWVQSVLDGGAGNGNVNTCTPEQWNRCIGPGDTCGGEVVCGRVTCGDDGRWGECERTIDTVRNDLHLDECNGIDDDCDDTIDEDCNTGECPLGQTRDPNTNQCVCAGSCAPGSQMDPGSCLCIPLCGDGICAPNETDWSCPIDCDDGGGGSCICGWDCPPDDPACAGFCGDGMCDVVSENSTTCPADCDLGGGSCICGWDCPPDDPACAGFCGDGWCDLVIENGSTCPLDCGYGGGGGDGGGGGGGDGGGGGGGGVCGDWEFWDWYVGEYGWEEANALYSEMCAM